MASSAVVSLAILKVNWDIYQKDYLENFVPILAECIRLADEDIISIPILQSDVEKRFGLKIPQNILGTLLRRLQKKGYITLENKVYTRNYDALKSLNFSNVQQEVIRTHEILIEDLRKFAAERFTVEWSPSNAEDALLSYLQENEIFSLEAIQCSVPKVSSKSFKYIVAVFIKHLKETHSSGFYYLETIVKGNMLANAIFLPDPTKALKKFKNTEVFFDSPFLMHALGYNGEPRKEPCIELLNLLVETGASLRCFSHTVIEIRGILRACADRIAQGKVRDSNGSFWESVEYFLYSGKTSTDVELLATKLETSLSGLKIRIVDKPDFSNYAHVISETELGAALRDKIMYRREDALDHDVNSISAIMRIRKGFRTNSIEECKALFVTNNESLVAAVCDFLKQSIRGEVPACFQDSVLTCLLWLKKPLKAPDLPIKRIIADCYAATQPDERLWKAYLLNIEKQRSSGQVSDDDYLRLRYDLEAKQILMERTLGEEQAFAHGTVAEILSYLNDRQQQVINDEVRRNVEVAKNEAELVKRQAAAILSKELRRELRITAVSEKFAQYLSIILKYISLALVAFGVYLTMPEAITDNSIEAPNTLKQYLLPGVLVLIFFLSICNLMWGTTVVECLNKLENWLARSLKKAIINFIDLLEK